MNKQYRICLIVPAGYPHAACFVEVALLLKNTLLSLGLSCDLTCNEPARDRINILLGYHLINDTHMLDGCEYIPYQLEQLHEQRNLYKGVLPEILKHATDIWDYSQENISFLKTQGIAAKFLPVGYHEALEQIRPAPTKDTDILFFGSTGGRREPILRKLTEDKNIKTQVLYGIYGHERDEWIGRSKIILNIHFFEAKLFETVRVSYLLNNRCFVVSEDSPVYPYQGVDMCLVPYENIIDTCYAYLADDVGRGRIAQQSYEQFKEKFPMRELVGRVL